jgi:hypothetical protein
MFSRVNPFFWFPCCHPEFFAVILSPFAALRVNCAKDLGSSTG